jgi:3-oxoacyl-[acyl-carrier-protein] synthase-3
MADLIFSNAGLSAVVTTLGGRRVMIEDERERLGLSIPDMERLQRSIGLNSRNVVVDPTTTTADLCLHSAERLLAGVGLGPETLDGLILVTQTPDFASPSTAISLQHRLGMRVETACFDMRLGCSGFVYGLAVAASLVEAGLARVLLCVGDVASRITPPDDHAITPLMGDAGAAILVERKPTFSRFQLYSDGSGEKGLYIPNSGLRRDAEDEGKPPLLVMDGAAVFNFTLKRVPALITDILALANWTPDQVDQFVLHQPNKYILRNIQKRLGLDDDKLPTATQSMFGNQNSASIPGTITGILSDIYSNRSTRTVFGGFGVGLSWAACAIETEPMFVPPSLIYQGNPQ